MPTLPTSRRPFDRAARLRAPALALLAGLLAGLGLAAVAVPGWLPLPWALAPLHSRCVGAMQLGLALALWAAWRGRDVALAGAPLLALAAAAAGDAAALLLHPADDTLRPAAQWLIGSALLGVVAAGLARAGRELQAPAEHADRCWLAAAAAAAAVAAALLAAPGWLAAHWPWQMGPAQAAAYVGPFAALAVLAWAVARERRRYVRRALLPALLASAAGVLAASAWHAAAFAAAFAAHRVAAYAWFAGFIALAVLALRRLAPLHAQRR